MLNVRDIGPYLLAFAAAGFLYIALADLIPAQRSKQGLRLTFIDLSLVLAVIAVVGTLSSLH